MSINPVGGEIQSQEINDNLSYLDSKASKPFSSAQASGEKITMDLLGEDVVSAITGDASVEVARGLENNRGVVYPLLNFQKDGAIHEVQDRVKNSILSAKVNGANPNKLYTIDWIGNGFSSGGTALWGMQISEYPRGNSITTSNQRILLNYSSDDFLEPTEIIVSRTINLSNEGLIFEITYDRSKFEGNALNIARAGGRGFGCVIHHDNYVYLMNRDGGGANNPIVFNKSTDEFSVFVPSGNKFIGYTFRYTEKPYIAGDKTSNIKLWSFKSASEHDEYLTPMRNFYPDATQDLMIREDEVDDYMGGAAHGDEILQKVEIYVDGRKISGSETLSLYCSEMKMFQTTFLYRDTSTTGGVLEHVATAKKIHTVNENGYTIEVTVEFLEELNLRSCLIGSLSLSRKDNNDDYIFTKAVLGSELIEVDLTKVETVFERVPSVSDTFIIGDGVSINWQAQKKNIIEGETTWINNSPPAQTKLYCNYAPAGYRTSVGEVFNQKTSYKYVLI